MLRTLLLFDIDGTLIRRSRAGLTAYERAIEACTGLQVEFRESEAAGKTDLAIIREVLDRYAAGPGATDEAYLVQAYLRYLVEAVEADPGEVCPGVWPLLAMLSGLPEIRLALGTGNLEKGARIKLEKHGLNLFFATGGFGSDASDRNSVIAAGVAKAEAFYETTFERIAVVGDTPRDVACARANGLHSIAVATGPFDDETLRESGASAVLTDLAQWESFLSILGTLSPTRGPGERAVTPANRRGGSLSEGNLAAARNLSICE